MPKKKKKKKNCGESLSRWNLPLLKKTSLQASLFGDIFGVTFQFFMILMTILVLILNQYRHP